jgi:hypothetical protein
VLRRLGRSGVELPACVDRRFDALGVHGVSEIGFLVEEALHFFDRFVFWARAGFFLLTELLLVVQISCFKLTVDQLSEGVFLVLETSLALTLALSERLLHSFAGRGLALLQFKVFRGFALLIKGLTRLHQLKFLN